MRRFFRQYGRLVLALAVSLVCVVVCGLLACSSGRQMTIQDIPVPKQPVFLVKDEKAFFDSFM